MGGIAPRKECSRSSAPLFPPPLLKMSIASPQWGHERPLMFSMMPSTGTLMDLTMFTAFRESSSETSWGVVTIIAPARSRISWITLSGSSLVPGGSGSENRGPPEDILDELPYGCHLHGSRQTKRFPAGEHQCHGRPFIPLALAGSTPCWSLYHLLILDSEELGNVGPVMSASKNADVLSFTLVPGPG